jgi:thiol-disulfide isomerase/thioredoxin
MFTRNKILCLSLTIFITCWCFGGSYDFSKLKKHARMKIIKQNHIVFYSASWCPACHDITPTINEFYIKYHKSHNFDIILMTLDFTESQFWDHLYKDDIQFNYVKWTFLKESKLYAHSGSIMPWITVFDKDNNKIYGGVPTRKILKKILKKLK